MMDQESAAPGMILEQARTFRHPLLRDAYAYWRLRCGDRDMPSRADLSPGEMRAFLSHVGLVEVREGTNGIEYSIRLSSTKWESVYGSMKGRILADFLPPEVEERWRMAFDSVRESAKPMRVCAPVLLTRKRWLTCELLVAPLSEDSVVVSTLFVVFTSRPRDEASPILAAPPI